MKKVLVWQNIKKINKVGLTFPRNWHHGLPLVLETESTGQRQLGYNGVGTVGLAARFIIASLLEADGAAAGSLVVSCRDADMVTAALVGQARMVAPVRTLPVDVQGPQLHLVIHQCFGVVTIGQVYPDNLLILWVEVVEPP